MIHARTLLLAGLTTLALACGGGKGNQDGGTNPDAALIDAGSADALSCTDDNLACADSAECCSGLCQGDVCYRPPTCTAIGDNCADSSECCAGSLCRLPQSSSQMICMVGLCKDEGETCAIDSDCCTLNCQPDMTCGPASGACSVVGDGCSVDGDCCSNNCGGTSCAGASANCDPIGEACTSHNSCCSDFCANTMGGSCGSSDTGCRCLQVTDCRAEGELCTSDLDCCNQYCDRPGGPATVGNCASLGACTVVGEPCGNAGISSACCSNACVDDGSGVATCTYLGGCLPINEICSDANQCCSGVCEQNGTTSDGRPVMRCGSSGNCLDPGEVCFTAASANCCPSGGGQTGCEPANSGVHRCFGGTVGCVLPGDECTDTSDCCTDSFNVQCLPGPADVNICCVPDGGDCAFGDVCCSGVCAPDSNGNLVCNPGCVASGDACTTDADCCTGCCDLDTNGNLVCNPDCGGCTDGQLGEPCGPTAPCCSGLSCVGPTEFKSCQLTP